MKEYAKGFYKSQAWKQTRLAFYKEKKGLCEECLKQGIVKAGVIVHHKIHITQENINNTTVTLDKNNLELLCRDCHGKKHGKDRRYRVDNNGNVII